MENNASTALYDLLVTRDLEPEILDSSGKAVSNPGEAELFSFDWKVDGKNYGTVVVLLGTDNELEVYYGDNLGRGMESEHKRAWYDFLAQLKNFASRNLLTFELNNINRLKYTMQGMSAIREGLFEGYYGRKNISYSDQPKQTRLMIRHTRNLGEGEARYRAIESLFVETADGERFRVPSRSLMHGKMLARHVAEGGTPYDAFGQHITEIVTELGTLSKFVRASQARELAPTARELTMEAIKHYHDLKAKARRMISQRGYREARDSFDPVEQTVSEHVVEQIKNMFVENSLDQRIEEALPLLGRLALGAAGSEPLDTGKHTDFMKELTEFEDWATSVTEATWARPDDARSQEQLQLLMQNPVPMGPDATNATERLYDIFGDDELFDRLAELAARDADADARPVIQDRLRELGIDLDITAKEEPESVAGMEEDLDVDGVMMTRPSNMSSESRDFDLERLRRLAQIL